MTNNNQLMIGEPETNKPDRLIETTWYVSTNHVNLFNMLASGLVMSPKCAGVESFEDAFNAFPGWIPIFLGSTPKKVIDGSISEADYLCPCIAEIKLNDLHGHVVALYLNGSMNDISFPDGINGTETAILVPAPLPAAWIERIIFRSKEDKKNVTLK